MRYFALLLAVAAMFSCDSQRTKQAVELPENYFFSGEFVYFADAANFYDCATGMRFPVSHTKAYLRIERSYLMLTPTPAQPLYVEFRGRLVDEPPMEGDGVVKTIVIDSLIGFKKDQMCRNDMLWAGVYESNGKDAKEILRLNPDYNYTGEIFDQSGAHIAVSGRWVRSGMAELLLIQSTPTEDVTGYELIPAQSTFVDNSGGEPKSFTKVYL